MTEIKTIQEEIKVAIEALEEGWDWPQDFADEDGDRHVIDGPAWIDYLPDEKSREAAKAYNDSVESDYAGAIEEMKRAAGLLGTGDIASAIEAASAAARFERQTGDDMFCRPIIAKIAEIDESIEDSKDDLASIERAWTEAPEAEALPGYEIWGGRHPGATSDFTPRAALEAVLSTIPREVWGHAMDRGGVSAELRENLGGGL